MAIQIVMDHTGDTRYNFHAADAKALLKAEERFKELNLVGFTAAVRTFAGEVAIARTFDPTAEETVFFRRLVGGKPRPMFAQLLQAAKERLQRRSRFVLGLLVRYRAAGSGRQAVKGMAVARATRPV
jgi:hypothetical protein